MGACSLLVKALGDELEDHAVWNFKASPMRNAARLGAAIRSKKTRTSLTALPGSTMRRGHWLYPQAWTDFRAVFNGHMWRDAISGIGQHHVAMDDDLPMSAVATSSVCQSNRFVAFQKRASDPKREKVNEAWDGTRLASCCLRMHECSGEALPGSKLELCSDDSRAGPSGEVLHEAFIP